MLWRKGFNTLWKVLTKYFFLHWQRIFAKYCRFQPDIFSMGKVKVLAPIKRHLVKRKKYPPVRKSLLSFRPLDLSERLREGALLGLLGATATSFALPGSGEPVPIDRKA